MNWMGGGLNRISKQANNPRKGRQRRKAQVRASLYKTSTVQSFSPFQPNFMKEDDMLLASTSNMSKKSGQDVVGMQTKLEHYQTFAPVVKRLRSLRPVENSHKVEKLCVSRATSVIAQSSTTKDNIIEILTETSSSDDQSEVEAENTIEEKRQRLLSQADWAGLQHTKPVMMNFSPNERSSPGNWRNFSRKHRRSDSPTLERPDVISILPVDKEDDGLYMTGALLYNNQSIKVKIGQDAFQSSQVFQPDQTTGIIAYNSRESSVPILLQPEKEAAGVPDTNVNVESSQPLSLNQVAQDASLSEHSMIEPMLFFGDSERLFHHSDAPKYHESSTLHCTDQMLDIDTRSQCGHATSRYEKSFADGSITPTHTLTLLNQSVNLVHDAFSQDSPVHFEHTIYQQNQPRSFGPFMDLISKLTPTTPTTSQGATRSILAGSHNHYENPIDHCAYNSDPLRGFEQPLASRASSSKSDTAWKRFIFGLSSPTTSSPPTRQLSLSVIGNHPSSD